MSMARKTIGILLACMTFLQSAYAADPKGVDFSTPVPETAIKEFKRQYTEGAARDFLPSNLLSKNYQLNEYELVLIGEDLRRELAESKGQNAPAVWAVLKDHADAYRWTMQRDLPQKPEVARPNQQQSNQMDEILKFIEEMQRKDAERRKQAEEPTQPSSQSDSSQYVISPESGRISDTSSSQQELYPIYTPEQYAQRVDQAKTPEEKLDAFSLMNINPYGLATDTQQANPAEAAVTPATEFDTTVAGNINPSENATLPEPEVNNDIRELIDIATDSALEKQRKQAKDFYVYAYHMLDYVKQHGTGNVPLRTDVVDDNGNYYYPSVTEQYQLEHALEVGFGFNVGNAVDLLLGVTVKNEDGILFAPGTTWKFSSFHIVPKLGKLPKIKNATGIDLQEGGRIVGLDIGHGTKIVGDTADGDIGLFAESEKGALSLSRESGLSLKNRDGKYYFGLGKLSLSFSTYTLQLSDCNAIQAGYKDDNNSLVFIAGKPKSLKDGDAEGKEQGEYDRILFAAQYITKNLLPNFELSFNFATADDKGTLAHPNGASKDKTTVYSLAFQSTGLKETSIQGEIARSKNENYDLGTTQTGNADYLDISHRFSKRLSGTLHAVNIDSTFDASSLVEDRTGEYLLTTNKGDGLADYLYESGQRGFDLSLQYTFPENASLAFGLSRYSLTTEGNSKTDIYLGGEKSWTVTDDDGNTVAELAVQQRLERRSVSNVDYDQNISTTTASLSATPWKDGSLESNFQKIIDNAEGNQHRFDISLEHNFYPLERVTITPRIEYQTKQGSKGLSDTSNAIDSTTLINSLSIGYEMVPDELTVSVLVSKEKYDIQQSEVDLTTGAKVDGEKRDVFGVGVGLSWEPKKIPGLTAEVSYRKDRVQYYTPTVDLSHQDVWEYSLGYSHPVGKDIRAAISFDYRSAKDRVKPIYDEVTKSISVSLDAAIGQNSTIRVEHTYESEYKPLDPKANYTSQTTIARIYNQF